MKATRKTFFIGAVLICALAVGVPTSAFAQSSHFEDLANQPFPENLPT